ncbi:MAG: hypothetical protein JNM52_01495 [Betaproteobacteria bacterium]|nr:hypothetical protein [Betaproteobacteria bacterium]
MEPLIDVGYCHFCFAIADMKPIHLVLKDADALQAPLGGTPTPSLARRFDDIARGEPSPAIQATCEELSRFLQTTDDLDAVYGQDAVIPLADIESATDAGLLRAAELDQSLARQGRWAEQRALRSITLGIALWAMRHQVDFRVVEPIVNALAEQANEAHSKQEASAVFALMQGVIVHVTPYLQIDLERSNPERPWRLLNLNLAITAIRSGDPTLIQFAFDALNQNLPDECAGFYQAAEELAAKSAVSDETRALIELARTKCSVTASH